MGERVGSSTRDGRPRRSPCPRSDQDHGWRRSGRFEVRDRLRPLGQDADPGGLSREQSVQRRADVGVLPPPDRSAYDPLVDPTDREPTGAAAPDPPVAIGSLGRTMAGIQARVQTVTLLVTTVVAIIVTTTVVPALTEPAGDRFDPPIALLILGVVCWSIFVLAVAVMAILPPLLLPKRDRAVFATHSWIGAREIRRDFGRASRATRLPTDAASAEAWLARNHASDRNRFIRVDALILAGRFDDARIETELLPGSLPLEAYRREEARALIADQMSGTVDEDALRAGVAAVPGDIDRAEAAASLAVFRARRALPDGDWRAPLLEARSAIPGSDVRVLVADFGLPYFEILFRKAVVPFTVVMLIIFLSLTVLPALLR